MIIFGRRKIRELEGTVHLMALVAESFEREMKAALSQCSVLNAEVRELRAAMAKMVPKPADPPPSYLIMGGPMSPGMNEHFVALWEARLREQNQS